MARGINKAIIIGNLGADPEIRHTQAGAAVANLNVATTEQWKDKQTGEQREQTEWHRIVIFGRLAEVAGEYLRKGSKVYLEGRLQTRKWQAQDGQDRYTTEIVAHDMQMLDSRGAQQGTPAGHQGGPAPQGGPQHQSRPNGPQGGSPAPQGGQASQGARFDAMDDDIPF